MHTRSLIERAGDIVTRAQRAGAETAEVLLIDQAELSAKVRMGEPERIEEAESHGIGLRVFKEGRTATAHTSDTTESGLSTLIEAALELARLSEPDPDAGPPDMAELATRYPELDLYDQASEQVDAAFARDRAMAAEDAARAHDQRITNSEGATYARTRSALALATSDGFSGAYRSSYHSLSVSPVVDDADNKKRVGSYWDARRFAAALKSPEAIGEEAARRTVDQLGARKVASQEMPVVFDPDAGRALLSLFFGCITGGAIYKRSSYLVDREGQSVASDLVHIVDRPLIPQGPGSRPFDGEGLASRDNTVVSEGVLRTYLLDTYSARKLERKSTGSAARGLGGRPAAAPSNFHLLPRNTDPEEIIREVDRGLYVTHMMGFGFNPVTGDFSRGAQGFWIEKGERTFPVGEITIGLNFDALWKSIDAIGKDLDPKTRFACPTFRVRAMTVAGN